MHRLAHGFRAPNFLPPGHTWHTSLKRRRPTLSNGWLMCASSRHLSAYGYIVQCPGFRCDRPRNCPLREVTPRHPGPMKRKSDSRKAKADNGNACQARVRVADQWRVDKHASAREDDSKRPRGGTARMRLSSTHIIMLPTSHHLKPARPLHGLLACRETRLAKGGRRASAQHQRK